MDTNALAFGNKWGKESALLSFIIPLCLFLTGCDTFQSSPSSATNRLPPPAVNSGQQVVSIAPAPEKPAPKPEPSPKPAEPPPPVPAAQPRTGEPKPATAAAPPKGAGMLVSLNAPAQPRVNESAATAPKPAASTASKSEKSAVISATTEVPQALFFKGPPRQAGPASHKFLWLGLGLGLCAAAGGGIAWLRFNRRRKPHEIIPDNREEICLPKELVMRECSIPPHEPELSEKEPVPVEKKAAFAERKPELIEKQPASPEKEPVFAEKKPLILQKKPELVEKEPALVEKA